MTRDELVRLSLCGGFEGVEIFTSVEMEPEMLWKTTGAGKSCVSGNELMPNISL